MAYLKVVVSIGFIHKREEVIEIDDDTMDSDLESIATEEKNEIVQWSYFRCDKDGKPLGE